MNKTNLGLGLAALVIAVGVAIYFSVGSSDASYVYEAVHIQCTACGNQYELSAQAAAEERAAAGNPRKKMSCPKCHKESGETMSQCDKCAKWYLPKPETAAARFKCPGCGHDPEGA